MEAAPRGARWHPAHEVRALFSGLTARNLTMRSAIFLPSGTRWATLPERGVPAVLPWGGMLVLYGEKDLIWFLRCTCSTEGAGTLH